MPLSASKRELLTQRVVFNHEILTHRVVARSFKVHTKDAKALLREFHEASDGRTHATHIVTGYVKPDIPYSQQGTDHASAHLNGLANGENGVSSSLESGASSSAPAVNGNGPPVSEADGTQEDAAPPVAFQPAYETELHTQKEETVTEIQCIMLIPEDELEARLPQFTRVLSNEIYSVEPSKLPDLVLLTDANAPVLSEADLAAVDGSIIGTIAHSRGAVGGAKKSGKSSKASTSNLKSNTSQPDLKRKASSSDVATTKFTTSKPTTSSKLSTSTTASSSKATSPVATGKDKKGKEKEKSATPSLNDMFSKGTEKGKKVDAGKGKQKGKDAMDIDEDREQEEEDEYGDMMLDDDDMMAEIDGLENGKVSTSKSSKSPATDNTTKGKSSTSKAKDESKSTGADDTSSKKVLQSNKPRKRRTVTKKVTEKNAKGFRVTREVETDESYSGSEEEDEEDVPVVASSSTTSAKKKNETEKEKEKEKEKKEVKPKKEKESTPAASSSTAAKKKNPAKPGEQSSLSSFFGKPKAGKK